MKKINLLNRFDFNLPILSVYSLPTQILSTGIRLRMFILIILACTNFNIVAQPQPESKTTVNAVTQKVANLKSIFELSRGLYDAGYYQNAAPYALQAYQQIIKLKNLSTNTVVVANNLAVIKFRLGENKQARRLLQALLVKLTAQKNKNSETIDKQLLTVYINLFELNSATGKYEQAEANLNQILKIDSQYYSATHPVFLHDKFLKIRLEFERGNNALSRQLLSEHLSYIPSGRLYNEARVEAGLLSAKLDVRALNYASAIKTLQQALVWQGEGDTQLAADIYHQLAVIFTKSEALSDRMLAKKYQHKQLEILKQLYGNNHPRIAQALMHFFYIKPETLSAKQKKFVREVYTRSFGPRNIRTLKILNRINNPSSVYNQAAL